ncbi:MULTISPECIES: hydroxymethylglutaryl-CoA reductase, degradative [unclassified Streptococcus]|uniref:hydroxymethylglutaryl-CoA reductase, degradative n=1 Tax=Streptococcus TaxID=1301 RepID=UPI001020A827|nr:MULTISPECIES: hydroxymethylglutaryl-CoA reductase, degradative [unclassified Streptococcus]MTQ42244.1 hydroxymethylglutaryl-CoA reductase, degradative [Streptococcus sp. BIOML-A1]RYS59951.1 hydroxymethylglutaryl-CoA reductase, degradative [Streptococcus sp. bf_0095]
MVKLTGFSKASPAERIEKLAQAGLLSEERLQTVRDNDTLPLSLANEMVENVLGTLALPFGIAPGFQIDDQEIQVPMVTEEPSVIAAASYAAGLIKRSGGFQTQVHKRQMIGQVALYDVSNKEKASQAITEAKEELLQLANQAYPSIVKRGGGARDLWTEVKGDFLICYLSVDPKEAMGANMLNTMLEALVDPLEELSGGQGLMAILSNLATDALVTARCHIDYRFLSRDPKEAAEIAQKIALASQLAAVDPYRAATHNKGIFNGIDAVVLATGNDWRAIEAGGHTYASRSGQALGLSNWMDHPEQQVLEGQLTLPMPIATKGGSIGLNPSVQVAHELLGNPDAQTLARIIVSVGLAQNFAALKALVSTGIQHGHMKLQAKSLALLAGATPSEVAPVVQALLEDKPFNLEKAQAVLEEIRQSK